MDDSISEVRWPKRHVRPFVAGGQSLLERFGSEGVYWEAREHKSTRSYQAARFANACTSYRPSKEDTIQKEATIAMSKTVLFEAHSICLASQMTLPQL